MLKWVARKLAPRWLWRRLRAWRLRRLVAAFRPYVVERTYSGVRLKVHIADPLAAGWYDHDWEPLPEVGLLAGRELTPGARVFDLGAHQGVVAMILAARVGPAGLVVAVEPLPHNVRVCAANVELNGLHQVRVESAAVGERPGELTIGADLNAQVAHAGTTSEIVRVPAVTVDELAARHGPPDVLFVDVEGYECQALRGAARSLTRTPACYVEVHQGHGLAEAGGSVAELFRLLPPDRYEHRVWSESNPHPRPAVGPADCPPAGRFFLVALPRTAA